MTGEKFTLMQYPVSAILGLIAAEDFVIPEIQRPFVWKRSQVRDLIDSLYQGYPTGYIITWKNPDVRTKDGGRSNGKKVLIDGQQRITALMAAIAGQEVLDEDFNRDRIKIAFNPLASDDSKRFAVQDASHLKDKRWIPDISVVFQPEFDPFDFSIRYCESNDGITPNEVNRALNDLKGIANRQIGVIELNHTLDIDEVTEIFIRINSKGTALSQSDFVMSKMASDSEHGGSLMRKAVDYFCHLAVKPEFYAQLVHDSEFQQSKYASKIQWLAKDYEDIYDPDYGDILRVSFMHQFHRGKLADLVSLLSGRDFKTKEFREDIVADSYQKLDQGILNFMNQYNFNQFVLAIKGAGFCSSKLLNSAMTMDFAYTLYLLLLNDPTIPNDQIKRYVQKWFVLSSLTSRYIGSPESQMDRFMVRLSIGYPTTEDQVRILKARRYVNPLDEITEIASRENIREVQNFLTSVRIHDDVLHYLIRLCERTRELPAVELGVSPRGVLALTQMTKAHAVLKERNYVLPQDVRAVFNDVCAHRLILRPQARVEGIVPQTLLEAVLDEIAPPQKSGGLGT